MSIQSIGRNGVLLGCLIIGLLAIRQTTAVAAADELSKSTTTSAANSANLSAAIQTGDLKTVQELLASGVSPGQPLESGLTPYQFARLRGYQAIADALVAAGAAADEITDLSPIADRWFDSKRRNPAWTAVPTNQHCAFWSLAMDN